MKKPIIKSISRKILYKTLIDFIHKEKLTEDHVILLNTKNFDDVVLDFREFYGESMTFDHRLLGVEIAEDYTNTVRLNKLGIIKDT